MTFSMQQILNSFKFLSLLFLPLQGRVQLLYRILDEKNSLCETKAYLNLGYWGNSAKNMDQACQDLAELMAQTAKIKNDSHILDVGFGYGDQDIFWMKKYQPQKITGINISKNQIQKAQEKVLKNDLAQKIEYHWGDATRLPFAEHSFDFVMALESAFHFRTRELFFKEAHRVLKTGGQLIMVDLCAVKKKLTLKDKVAEIFGRSFWQIPKENMYDANVFSQKLSQFKFSDVVVKSIWHEVYPGYLNYAKNRLHDPEVIEKLNPVFRKLLLTSLKARKKLDPDSMDYILVSATKK